MNDSNKYLVRLFGGFILILFLGLLVFLGIGIIFADGKASWVGWLLFLGAVILGVILLVRKSR